MLTTPQAVLTSRLKFLAGAILTCTLWVQVPFRHIDNLPAGYVNATFDVLKSHSDQWRLVMCSADRRLFDEMVGHETLEKYAIASGKRNDAGTRAGNAKSKSVQHPLSQTVGWTNVDVIARASVVLAGFLLLASALCALRQASRLIGLGHLRWTVSTAGKRDVMVIGNLLYYAAYVPHVIFAGFLQPLPKHTPKFHGKPGQFARRQVRFRMLTATMLAVVGIVLGSFIKVSPLSWTVQMALGGGLLAVIGFPLYMAFVWADKARKGCEAELDASSEIMKGLIVYQSLLKGTDVHLYWGRTRALPHSGTPLDIGTRIKHYFRGLAGKSKRVVDMDLVMQDRVSGLYFVFEVKSYDAHFPVSVDTGNTAVWQATESCNSILKDFNDALRAGAIDSPIQQAPVAVPVICHPHIYVEGEYSGGIAKLKNGRVIPSAEVHGLTTIAEVQFIAEPTFCLRHMVATFLLAARRTCEIKAAMEVVMERMGDPSPHR